MFNNLVGFIIASERLLGIVFVKKIFKTGKSEWLCVFLCVNIQSRARDLDDRSIEFVLFKIGYNLVLPACFCNT